MRNIEGCSSVTERYRGCLVGGAVGDALGAPVEFYSSQQIRLRYGVLRDMVGGGNFGWKEGETTDDTDLTLCIVDSLITLKKYKPEDISGRFLEWLKGNPTDIGGTTYDSLVLLSQGHSWRKSGKITALKRAKSAGNGSLMRTAPIGLYFRGRPDKIDRAAADVSGITHADKSCIAACQIASQLISHLATGHERNASVKMLKDSYPASTYIGSLLRKTLSGDYNSGHPGWVLNTLGIAITSLLEASDFEETVTASIQVGGDTDTQAAVAGAFAGSFWGIGSVPSRWKDKLNPVDSGQLESKADELCDLNAQMTGLLRRFSSGFRSKLHF